VADVPEARDVVLGHQRHDQSACEVYEVESTALLSLRRAHGGFLRGSILKNFVRIDTNLSSHFFMRVK
jgi:hypothetical protein